MRRLIDADALCERIREVYDGYMLDECGCTPIDFENMVDEQPTAYDVDKVVEEINGMEVVLSIDCISADNLKFTNKILRLVKDGAIERIRKGGVE